MGIDYKRFVTIMAELEKGGAWRNLIIS